MATPNLICQRWRLGLGLLGVDACTLVFVRLEPARIAEIPQLRDRTGRLHKQLAGFAPDEELRRMRALRSLKNALGEIPGHDAPAEV